jgi:hypothetical protein
MATLGASYLNLMDMVQREKADHTVATVAEILNQQNPMLNDIAWKTCNDGSQHINYIRTKLPTAQFLQVGGGVPVDKSNVSQVTEATGRIGVACEVSKRIAEFNGNSAAQRALESKAMLEGINQKWANAWFYGNAAKGIPTGATAGIDPLGFSGLSARFGQISGAAYAEQMIDAGGTGTDNSSIWFVVNGPSTVSGLVPNGAGVGLKHTPVNGGVAVSKTLANGNIEEVYQDIWELHCGLSVADYRGVVRIPNIDISNLVSESSAADLIKLMIKAQHRLTPVEGMGVPVIYCSRTVAQMLDIQALNKTAGNFTAETVDGKRKTMFRGYQIRTCHALRDDEERVV